MKSFKEMTKLQNEIVRSRTLCPTCGHSIMLGRKNKIICTHCGKYVFKTKEEEFKYRIKEQLNKK